MDNKKIVNFIYVVTGILSFLVLKRILGDLFEYYQLAVLFEGANHLPQAASILIGSLIAVVCIYNKKSNEFALDVVSELKKVTWPSQKETYAATVVVIITLLIMAVVLYAFDMLWGYLVKLMIT